MNRALFALLFAASLVAQAPAPKAAPAAKPAPAAPAAKPAPAATGIVANKDSKIFHKADCKGIAKMKAENKVSFASSAEATKAGYKPCKTCKP
jgi:competence protein ComEC